jgi:hypothetical protein
VTGQLPLEGIGASGIRPGCCWGCGRKLYAPITHLRFGYRRGLWYAAVVCSDDCYARIFS